MKELHCILITTFEPIWRALMRNMYGTTIASHIFYFQDHQILVNQIGNGKEVLVKLSVKTLSRYYFIFACFAYNSA